MYIEGKTIQQQLHCFVFWVLYFEKKFPNISTYPIPDLRISLELYISLLHGDTVNREIFVGILILQFSRVSQVREIKQREI